MKIVNDGLPEAIFKAICNVQYDRGDSFASATRLLASPRQFWLEKRHHDKVEALASDRIWSLLGTAMHYVVEQGGSEKTNEIRLKTEVLGQKITGTTDFFKDGIVSDFKLTSVWVYVFRSDRIEEWTQQLNVYAHMLRLAGHEVKGLQIICIFRDWQKNKYRFEDNYPPQVAIIPIKLWKHEEAELWITERVQMFLDYQGVADDKLPYCTNKDKWQKPDKYAVMKKGNKRAVKLYEDEASALAHASQDKAYYIEDRLSEPTKCLQYCDYASVCNQHQQYLKEQEESNEKYKNETARIGG